MAKPEWGIKRLCANCSASYYDMKKNPPICPSCGTTFDPEALLKSRRRMVPAEAPKVAAKKVEAPVPTPEDAEVAEGDEEEIEAVEGDDDEDDDEVEVEIADDKE